MVATENTRDNMFSGMFWTFLRQSLLQIFGIIEGIILARLLEPSDYGLVAMPAIFMQISGCFIDSGFATALVRNKDRKDIDYSTVFVTNVVLTAFFATILCSTSSLIANFYNEPRIRTIVCANAVLLFLNSFLAIQNTRLTIKMDFKAQNIFRTITNIVIGCATIICALCGMGVWALVWPNFIMPFLNGYLYYKHDPWFPKFKFSWEVWKRYFSFGSKLLASNLISTIYDNLNTIVIGKKFSASDLGYFSKANSYATIPAYTLQTIVGPVAFPVMSAIKEEETLHRTYLKLVSLSCYLVFPLIFGLAVLAKPFILILITEKWVPAVIFLQLLCFARMWGPFNVLCKDFIQVKGRTDLILKVEVLTKVMSTLTLIICIPLGITAMCIGLIASSFLTVIINMHSIKKVGGFTILKQIQNIIPAILYSSSMALLIYFAIRFIDSLALQLICGIIIGASYYILISIISNSRDFHMLISIIKDKFLSKLRKNHENKDSILHY